MSARVLFAILLLGFSVQQCTIGCLKCNALNQCLLCDITNNYFLNGNTCSLSTQTNCNLLSLSGNCVQCNTNFYLDVNSQKCLSVTSSNVVPNCNQYNSGQVCVSCTGNFFISAGRCAAVNSTIANCQVYSNNGVCSSCASGYIMSNDMTGCLATPSNNTCMFYTYVGCRQCASGFVNNPNFYFTYYSSMPYIYSMFLVPLVQNKYDWIGLSVCQATTIQNCAVFSAFNFCSQCNSGFYLQNGNCVAFPLPVIFGCLTYSSLTTCSQCQAGMYLNQNACLTNAVIPNCLTYSGSSSTTTCTTCNGGFFLQGNVCVNRTVSANIQNCQTASVTADVCAACSTGFVLTSDNRACLAVIANCAQYSTSTFQTTTLQCSQCRDGFYLTSSGSTTVCVAGTIQFCLTYQVNSNTCTKCANGYYLNNNVCTAHINIANCATYDSTRPNYCSVCNSGFYNFAYTTVCVQTTPKPGCSSYSFDGNSCITCQAGYYLTSGNCNLIPSTFANCATYSGTTCTLCNTNYMVNTLPTVGTCVLPMDYINAVNNSPCAIMADVASDKTPTWTDSISSAQQYLTCGTCNNYMYGYTPLKPEAICVATTQLTMYKSYTAVSNCLRYGLNYDTTPQIVCMQCATGFYISGYGALNHKTIGTTCESTCSFTTATNSPAIIVDDMLGFVNICVPQGSGTDYFISTVHCNRYGRISLEKATTTATLLDYACFMVNPGTGTTPTNFLMYDFANGADNTKGIYWYESPSASSQITSGIYTGIGYSNTVDATSVVPNVFNYLGLLQNPVYTIFQLIRPFVTGTDAAINTAAGGNLLLNNLNNCDIVALHITATGHTAYDAAATAFTPVAANRYACMRCQFGYQNQFTGGLAVASTPAFPSCVQMSTCASPSTVYGGLTQFLNSILSCHVCSQSSGSSTFPTIYIETYATTNTNGAFAGFITSGALTLPGGATVVTLDANSGFKCSAAPSVVVVTDAASSNTGAITNCAVYGRIAAGGAIPIAQATIKPTVDVCLACAANYFPEYFGAYNAAPGNQVTTTLLLPKWVVKSCTASKNCDNSVVTQFNSCARCRTDQENNVTPAYYAFHDLTLSNCYQSSSKNCFILASGFSTTSNTNTCDVCKAGYFLNVDKVCEQYKVPNQAVNNGIFINAYASLKAYGSSPVVALTGDASYKTVRLHYLLSYKQLQYGVNACSSGYTLAPVNPWAPRLCVWSSHVYNNTGSYAPNSKFINNCIRYNMTQTNGNNVCGGCNTGFIPLQDGSRCVSSSSLPNCVYSQNGASDGLCYQCAPNFYNVNGICVSTTIPNCAAYVNTQWSFTSPGNQQCSKCIDGFYLSSDNASCSPGLVSNCIQYTQGSATGCIACANGFVWMTLNSVYYCYPVPATLNCASLQDTSSTSGANYGTISCAICNANSVQVFGARNWPALGRSAEAQTLCMPFTPIANCVSYSQENAVIKANTFACTVCASGYWYSASNSTCVPRVNVPAQCTNYSLTSDVCTVCASGSFLSTDGRNCVSFPNGIFQCQLYSAANTCTQCNSGYYLSSNTCVASTTVNNCAIYAANFTCSACMSGFFLNNATSCVTATASNCATFTSISACASCNTGFGLQTTNGVTSCVATNLPNCVNATNIAPFTCLVCSTGYFPNSNGACTLVAQTIANCLTYDSATTCSRCASNSILNVARTACNATYYSSFVDPNCAQNFLVAQPACTVCQFGMYFVNGTCTSCSNNTFASGCMSCDPVNNNVCLACRPKYYMNAQGGCVANNPTPTPTPTPGTNNGTTTNNTAAVTKAVGLAITLATIYFDRF